MPFLHFQAENSFVSQLLSPVLPGALPAEARGPLRGQELGAEGDRAPEPPLASEHLLAEAGFSDLRIPTTNKVSSPGAAELPGGSLLRPSIALASPSASMLSFTGHLDLRQVSIWPSEWRRNILMSLTTYFDLMVEAEYSNRLWEDKWKACNYF